MYDKSVIYQEDNNYTHIHIKQQSPPAKYMMQIMIELKGGIESTTLTVGDFTTSFLIMDRKAEDQKGYSRLEK